MNKFSPVDSINGNTWLYTDDQEEYIKVYIWLTSTPLENAIDFEGKALLGLSHPVMSVEHRIPENPQSPEKDVYWRCNAWIIKSFIKPDGKPGFSEKYFHFKMNLIEEYSTPPIPEHLVKIYYDNVKN